MTILKYYGEFITQDM